MNPPNITASQVWAFARHVPSFAAGAVFYAAAFGTINATDASSANHAIAQISGGFSEIVAGVSVLVPIAMGALAALKSSPLVQMVLGAAAMLNGKASAANMSAADQKTIMEATSTLPKVDAVVTNDKLIAATTPPKVVSAGQVAIK